MKQMIKRRILLRGYFSQNMEDLTVKIRPIIDIGSQISKLVLNFKV